MRWIKLLASFLLVALLASCGDVSATANSAPNGPGKPIARTFNSADLVKGKSFLAANPKSDQVDGHEFDAYVLAAVRQNAKADSLRITLLGRDGQIWIVDPGSDTVADDFAAWIGRGDWVVCHVHDRDGFTSMAWNDKDLRLIASAS